MRRYVLLFVFVFIMLTGVVFAMDENIIIKDAPDYKIYFNNSHVAIISNLKKDETLSKNLIFNNNLIERYRVYLPIYVQIDDDGTVTRASLINNWETSLTEKELTIKRLDNKFEVMLEQVVGYPDGVGMTSETINQGRRIYDYDINWTIRGLTQKNTKLKICVIREYEQEKFDYIYKQMINKNFTEIYQTIMEMSNIELSVLENYFAAKYGVEWDVDEKLIQELKEINIAKISFSDLNEKHWAYNVIKSMAIKGILNGYEDNTFRPENNLSRAEAAQIISKLFILPDVDENNITDVEAEHWAYRAIKNASKYIPMNGTTFKPEDQITRKDFIIAIMNIKGNATRFDTNIFSDLIGLNDEEIDKINTANSLGIVDGYEDGSFRPNGYLTRAEACAILTRSK